MGLDNQPASERCGAIFRDDTRALVIVLDDLELLQSIKKSLGRCIYVPAPIANDHCSLEIRGNLLEPRRLLNEPMQRELLLPTLIACTDMD